MKKKNTMTLRAASAMMVAVMSLTAFSGIAANAGEYTPEQATPISYAQTMEETFDTSHDAAAPNVNKTAFEKAVENLKKVGTYSHKEGKYYIIKTTTKSGSNESTHYACKYELVKVERAYEEPAWWGGTERTIQVRFCGSGETRKIQPNMWLAYDTPFYEIDNFVC